MKIISLNTWGGRAGIAGLRNFFQQHQDIDVFCLQEIWQVDDLSLHAEIDPGVVTDLLAQISESLPHHRLP